MAQKGYYSILFFIIVNFLALLGMLSEIKFSTYVIQVFVIFAFLFLALMLLYFISRKARFAWPFSIFFFSLNLMNAVYMFFYSRSTLLVIYALSSLIAFILSVYNTDLNTKKEFDKIKIKKIKKPKIIIEDLKPEKKVTKVKTSKKKVTKKKIATKKKKVASTKSGVKKKAVKKNTKKGKKSLKK